LTLIKYLTALFIGLVSSVPDGFLLCDGGTASREDDADLFTAIGETYGSGDGSTNFTLPNLSSIPGMPAGIKYIIKRYQGNVKLNSVSGLVSDIGKVKLGLLTK